MKCEEAFDKYLRLDKDERVPFAITIHLFFCPVCRTGVRQLTKAEAILSQPLAGKNIPVHEKEFSDPVIQKALERIKSAGFCYPIIEADVKRMSLIRWIIAGFALIGGFTIVPFSFVGSWSHDAFGSSFFVPYYLICGLGVTAYCGMFVGTNIDLFVKKFGFRHTSNLTEAR